MNSSEARQVDLALAASNGISWAPGGFHGRFHGRSDGDIIWIIMGCTTPISVFNLALFPGSRFGWFNTSCCTGKIKALTALRTMGPQQPPPPPDRTSIHSPLIFLAAGSWTQMNILEMHRKRARSGHITALAVDVPVGANKPHLTVAKWKHSSHNIRWIFLRCAWPRIIVLHLANLLGTAWLLVYCLHAIGSPHFDYLFTCPHFCHNCGGYLAINGCFAAAQMKTQATLPWWKVLRVMTSTHRPHLPAATASLCPGQITEPHPHSSVVGTRMNKTHHSQYSRCHQCPSPVPERLRPGRYQVMLQCCNS